MPCSRLTPLSLQAEHHLIPLTSNPSELILLAAWLSGKTSRPPREPWLDPAPQAGAEGSPCSHRDQLLTDCQASPAVRLAVISPWFIIKTLSCWCTGNLLSLREPQARSTSGVWAGTTSLHRATLLLQGKGLCSPFSSCPTVLGAQLTLYPPHLSAAQGK